MNADAELDEASTTEEISLVQVEGTRQVKRKAKYYSMDAIIAVGYRVNTKKATKFRQWATKTLKEYIREGFVLNDYDYDKNILKDDKFWLGCKSSDKGKVVNFSNSIIAGREKIKHVC